VGCELDRDSNTITFYLNGKSLGVAFEDVDDKADFYPAASVSRFCGCSFNFGRRRSSTNRHFEHHEVFLEYIKKTGRELPAVDEPGSNGYVLGETCSTDFQFAPSECKSLWDALPGLEDWMVRHWQSRNHHNTFVPPPLGNLFTQTTPPTIN